MITDISSIIINHCFFCLTTCTVARTKSSRSLADSKDYQTQIPLLCSTPKYDQSPELY